MTRQLAYEVSLPCEYEKAVDQVAEALKKVGFGILTRIDVRATLKEKLGEEFRPYVILGACNPPLAHKALSREARAGLLLPCNVTVEAGSRGNAIVRIADPETLLEVGGLSEDKHLREVAGEAAILLKRAAEALSKRS